MNFHNRFGFFRTSPQQNYILAQTIAIFDQINRRRFYYFNKNVSINIQSTISQLLDFLLSRTSD